LSEWLQPFQRTAYNRV